MKILFLLGATSRVRNFQETLIMLADRGHDIVLAGRLRKRTFELPETVVHERIRGRVNPTQRVDGWRDFVDVLRGARDYVRYFDPRYAQATRLVRRAYEIAPTEFVLFCERHPWMKRHWHLASHVLARCEDVIPSDPGFETLLREEAPDVVLVTPLVTFDSYQTDYVKSAHRLGIPVVFIPFSWDNLTNKGLMRIHPDRVLVWNDLQRREAIELHGCPPDTVAVIGAPRFDDFFDKKPSTTREAFCAERGLDPTRPLLLYLGSSQLAGPNEMELVRRWAESIRGAEDETVRRCNLLVRPHPALRTSYVSVDLSDLAPVAVALDASRSADQELFDSLYHAHAAVGLNTSAMLEAAIVGRPVLTLVLPDFDEGQIGTMHFHYLVEAYGGLATVAHDFAEHHRQLARVVQGDPVQSERSRAFAGSFLRPCGIDQPVAPRLAAEIERAAALVKRPRRATPAWHYPARVVLNGWLRRRYTARQAAVDSSIVGRLMSLRPVKTALEEMQRDTSPILVGPWVDTAGNEVLYWIPFLRWVAATYGFPPERLIAVSLDGASEWYGSIVHRCLDVRTLFSPVELEHWMRRIVPQSEQNPKQAVLPAFDQEVLERVARRFDLSAYQVLHPSMLFRIFRRLHTDRALEQMSEVLRHERFAAHPQPSTTADLPRSFIAMSVAFSDALPANADNRRFLGELVSHVTVDHDVVIVDMPPPADVTIPPSSRVRMLAPVPDVRCAQTQVLAGARAFVGSYGEMAILAAYCGTPATAYHSERLPLDQQQRLQAAAATGGWATVELERARRFKGLALPAGARA